MKLTAQSDVVEVGGGLDGLDLAADVVLLDLVAEVRNSGVGRVIGAEDLNGLLDHVGTVDVIDYNTGQIRPGACV